jgi:hypothetical protein
MKGGGFGDKIGIFARGSPVMLRMIRNLSGKSARIGQVLSAAGLYFFFAANTETCSELAESNGTNSDRCEGVLGVLSVANE